MYPPSSPSLPVLHPPPISTHNFCLSQALPLSLPQAASFSLVPLAVCSLIIRRFFLSTFSSKLYAPYYIIYMFLTLFVNSVSSGRRFLCSLYLSAFTGKVSRGPFRPTTCTILYSTLSFALFFWLSPIFHFDRWLFVSLSYYLAFPASSVAVPSILPRSFVTACSHPLPL